MRLSRVTDDPRIIGSQKNKAGVFGRQVVEDDPDPVTPSIKNHSSGAVIMTGVTTFQTTLPTGLEGGEVLFLIVGIQDTAVRNWVQEQDEWQLMKGRVNSSDITSKCFKLVGEYQPGLVAPTIVSEAFPDCPLVWAIIALDDADPDMGWEYAQMQDIAGSRSALSLTSRGDLRKAITYLIRQGSVGSGATQPSGHTELLDIRAAGNGIGIAVSHVDMATAATITPNWGGATATNYIQGGFVVVPKYDAPSFTVIESDDGSVTDPLTKWGTIAAEAAGRWTRSATGAYDNGPYRQAQLQTADDAFGSRTELGTNDWRFGLGGATTGDDEGTFALFQEGQTYRLREHFRLETGFDITEDNYQAINQFKDTQPQNLGDGQAGWDLTVQENELRVLWNPGNEVPFIEVGAVAIVVNTWYAVEFQVHFTQDEDEGWLQCSLDGTPFAEWEGSTLGIMFNDSDDYFAEGQSIPQHWRVGQYRGGPPPGTQNVRFADFEVALIPNERPF